MATTTQPTTQIPENKRQRPVILRNLVHLDWAPYVMIAALQVLTAFVFLSNSSSGISSWFDEFPLDDGWIHMVYARSFAEHAQLWYNTGVPETGMTSPVMTQPAPEPGQKARAIQWAISIARR